jgi:hypothetical protein
VLVEAVHMYATSATTNAAYVTSSTAAQLVA